MKKAVKSPAGIPTCRKLTAKTTQLKNMCYHSYKRQDDSKGGIWNQEVRALKQRGLFLGLKQFTYLDFKIAWD